VCSVDVQLLWPNITLGQIHALRELPPLGPGDDPTIPCPVCGDQAFLSGDRRIVHCPWICGRAMPGPASDALLQVLRRRRARRGKTIRRTI
jgi:hypothetical protein